MSEAKDPKDPRSERRPGASARELGTPVLSRLSAVIRIGRSYQTDNQVFGAQLDGFMAALGPVLEADGEAVLVELEGDLYLNGRRIPIRGQNIRFHRQVLEELRARQIAGFRALRGGLDKVLPAIHASTTSPDDVFAYEAVVDAPGVPSDDPFDRPEATDADAGFDENLPTRGVVSEGGQGAPKGAVRKNFSSALAGARSLLTTTTLQGGMEMRHAKRVVQPLVDGAFSDEPVVLGLSTLTHRDEFTYAHAVNVTLVAVTMGHFLEMDRRALADLGVAALLHDIGKAAVAGKIHHPIEAFTQEEKDLAERHPLEGVKLLARSTTLNPTTLRCMRVALEHHAGPDGVGFPGLGADWHTSMLSRIVAVADCYVSLQMHRSMRGAFVTPFEALGMMLGPLKGRFHPAMLWALVQTVGFYPPGQLVELDDGTIAVVLAPNRRDLARPNVRPILTSERRRLAPGESPDLKPLPKERSVKRALRGAEYPGEETPRAA
ncbi:MAG: HD domain-containing protein [Candidatus Eisenbacteria bacterium]|uniref:HD domain-containing protein n=1 Tax=Eiseniibacteriota bacterium TaxID=2212470 RepID=A0A538U1H4_UNCEI|nr:MAG: HD domain-containing protein [Candidatus Eisenbacteria bacterium]